MNSHTYRELDLDPEVAHAGKSSFNTIFRRNNKTLPRHMLRIFLMIIYTYLPVEEKQKIMCVIGYIKKLIPDCNKLRKLQV